MPPTRFSVIVPTYQRRSLVVRMVAALERQQYRDFEVIVVVDGSTDGTAADLRERSYGFPITVLEQRNQGAAVARNSGAAAARGEVLLFLDDDMEAHPAMLSEHDSSHRQGADLVLGHLPLHPDSPPTEISAVTGRWAERRRRRLATPGTDVPLSDLLTGQMSLRADAFKRIGGFDVTFTRDGLFGGEDVDFGYRARKAGLRIVFNPAAISYQYYAVDAATYTRRSRETGRSAQELSVKHPERADELLRTSRFATRRQAVVGGLASVSPVLSRPLRALAIHQFNRPRVGPGSTRLFFAIQRLERVQGARQARRALRLPRAAVLAYHAISDLRSDPVLHPYGVAPQRFAEQLDGLVRRGWRFVSLESVLEALDGKSNLPSRAVLLTFDDAYADLLTAALPVLTERGIPAVAFAVSGRVGATNAWDQPLGARSLDLLDAEGLRTVAGRGIAVESHGITHRSLTALAPPDVEEELRGSKEQLCTLGLPAPRVFSYPYGEWNPNVASQVREAGYAAAFTVDPGVVNRLAGRYALPRIEIYAGDTPRAVRLKLATAAWPERLRRRLLRLLTLLD